MVSIILPLLIVLAMGAYLAHRQILTPTHMQALGDYVLKVALPIFLFYVLATREISEIWQPNYLFLFTLVSLFIFVVAFFGCHLFLKLPKNHSAVFALGASMSNTGFIGVGVLPLILEQEAAIYLSLTLIVESAIIFPLSLILAELFGRQVAFGQIARQIFAIIIKNPIIMAIVLGVLFAFFEIKLPTAFDQSLKMIGQTASPVALLVIGARLLHIRLTDFNRLNLFLSLLKVVVMPLTMLMVFLAVPNMSRELVIAAFVLSTLPMTVTYSLFAQSYQLGEQAVASLLTSMLFWLVLAGGYLYLIQYL